MPEKLNNNPDGLTVDYLANWMVRQRGYPDISEVIRPPMLEACGVELMLRL